MQGKKLVFVTNNSAKSRKGYLGKFTSLGLDVSAEEIYSSSYAAAAYLESINFPKDKKVPAAAATHAPDTKPPVVQQEPFTGYVIPSRLAAWAWVPALRICINPTVWLPPAFSHQHLKERWVRLARRPR